MAYLHVYENKKKPKSFSKKTLISNLSQYLNVEPATIEIIRNENGKPGIDGINFSISHSKHLIVQVFTQSGDIGIDVEFIDSNRNFMQLAERYFHIKESQYLQTLTETGSAELFYNLWTAKEAVCKAEGGRLWYYLADNYLTNDNKMKTIVKGFKLLSFPTVPGFALTVAISDSYKYMEVINEI